ncbi:hypothetical protein LTR36_009228 [Oleoguttula mirabilis]|uniref:Uncharacterized protein n=1 Tax=Oleoguttula mirabilis TaxID=1507867 RepID=A0AAV9J6U3_9PEZI|nr:hypothetical protein LTR36_009228 [Oleoguttula mirabilis]
MYKTNDRAPYDRARATAGIKSYPEPKEVLLYNMAHEILDGSLATPYFRRGERWITPASACGGLQGTSRRWALEKGLCIEGTVKTDELLDGEEMWLSNGAQASVANCIFAPERQAFKAMVVRANDSMTVQGATKLVEYAHAGLSILLSGGLSTYLVSFNTSGDAYVNETLTSLVSLANVHVVPYDGLAASVAALRIMPLTKVDPTNTYWRRDDVAKADYVFVYKRCVHHRVLWRPLGRCG